MGGELFTVPQWYLTMGSLSVQKKKMLAHATLPAGVRELTGNAFAIFEGISTMPTAVGEIDEFWSAHPDPAKDHGRHARPPRAARKVHRSPIREQQTNSL